MPESNESDRRVVEWLAEKVMGWELWEPKRPPNWAPLTNITHAMQALEAWWERSKDDRQYSIHRKNRRPQPSFREVEWLVCLYQVGEANWDAYGPSRERAICAALCEATGFPGAD